MPGALIALVVMLMPEVARAQFLSPGPLARSHAKVDSETACAKCHSEGRRVGEERCLACHEKIKVAMDARRGYHAKLIRASAKPCSQCHPDHQGREFPLIRWDPKKSAFQHGETGWELAGAHGKVECQKCHKLPDHRYMIPNDCASCHKDIHKPSLGAACGDCHDETKFKPAPRFDHAHARYPLEGKHAPVACAKCHPASPPTMKFREIAFARCNDCHRDPHNGGLEPLACARCHTPRDWKEILASFKENHAPGVFPLRGRHLDTPCVGCHKTQTKTAQTPQTMKGAPVRCDACHQSPHRAPFGNRCNTCHTEKSWPALLTQHFGHELSGFALRGAHDEVPCVHCHPARGTYAQRFRSQKFDRCDRCHKDPHATTYKTESDPRRCESCHAERAFVPSTFTAARHVAPLFAIDGAHTAVPCASCHRQLSMAGQAVAAAPAARLKFEMHPAARDCAVCHTNPHGDGFKKEMIQGGCRGCHIPQDWKLAKIDHDKTGFPLLGKHARVACDACHTQPAGPPDPMEKSKRNFGGLKKECITCHGDPHFGQFVATRPVKQCDGCHGWDQWKGLTFDHDRDARLPLEGAHEKVKCEACHERRKSPAGDVVVYRNGRTSCEACHDNHHERPGTEDWKDGAQEGRAQ